MAIICGHCGLALTKIRSGINVSETFRPGFAFEKPYRLWKADLFVCETENCRAYGVNIVADFAASAFAEHHQENFAEQLESNPPDFFWHEKEGA